MINIYLMTCLRLSTFGVMVHSVEKNVGPTYTVHILGCSISPVPSYVQHNFPVCPDIKVVTIMDNGGTTLRGCDDDTARMC